MQNDNKENNIEATTALYWGIAFSFAFTALIWVIRPYLPQIDFAADTGMQHYYWKLPNPTWITRASAWGGYVLHQVAIWGLIWQAQKLKREKLINYSRKLHRFNVLALGANAFFITLHLVQTAVFYDGTAQDVSIFSAQGSVILMLVLVLLMENQRRGLFFGYKVPFLKQAGALVRTYHGYIFSWAVIYTFWYHPMENSMGHLIGFFYTFFLLLQGSLFFTRAHVNKWWMVTQEVIVLFHGTLVAMAQGADRDVPFWPMFFFGFAALFVVTQMYGLGLKRWMRWVIIGAFIVAVTVVYNGRWADTNEIIRIPIIEYGFVFILALFIQIGIWVKNVVSK